MVPMDEYPANHYPSFCSGSGFIISRNASERLFETAKITDNFRFPDVHLTGILRLKSKLPNPVETASGLFSFLSQKISSTCKIKKYHINEHRKVFSFRKYRNHRSPNRPKSNQMKVQSQSQFEIKLSSPTPASLNLTSQKTAI